MKCNPRYFFAYAKRFKKKHNNVERLKFDGKSVSKQNELADVFLTYYVSALLKPDEENTIVNKDEFFY